MENLSDFDFYLKFTKPLVLNLPQINDRVLAAAWVKKLAKDTTTEEKIRLDYLKLLLFVLQRKKLAPPFTKHPNATEVLESFPQNQTLVDVAKTIIETENEHNKQKWLKRLRGEGDFPPYISDFSADLLEYVAVQTIDNFGVHAYFAVSKCPLSSWYRVDKQLLPKAAKSMLIVSPPPPTLLEEVHSTPEISEAQPPSPPAPPAENPPPSEPETTEPETTETDAAPEPEKPETPPKKKESPKKSTLGASPPSSPIGKISPPIEEWEPPSWGSNLLEAKFLDDDLEGIEKEVQGIDDLFLSPIQREGPGQIGLPPWPPFDPDILLGSPPSSRGEAEGLLGDAEAWTSAASLPYLTPPRPYQPPPSSAGEAPMLPRKAGRKVPQIKQTRASLLLQKKKEAELAPPPPPPKKIKSATKVGKTPSKTKAVAAAEETPFDVPPELWASTATPPRVTPPLPSVRKKIPKKAPMVRPTRASHLKQKRMETELVVPPPASKPKKSLSKIEVAPSLEEVPPEPIPKKKVAKKPGPTVRPTRAQLLLQKKKQAELAPPPPPGKKPSKGKLVKKKPSKGKVAAPFSPGEPFAGYLDDEVQQYLTDYNKILSEMEEQYRQDLAEYHRKYPKEEQALDVEKVAKSKQQLGRFAKLSSKSKGQIPKEHDAPVELEKSIHLSPAAREIFDSVIEGPSTSTGITHPRVWWSRPRPQLDHSYEEDEKTEVPEEFAIETQESEGLTEEDYATMESAHGHLGKDPRLVSAFNQLLEKSAQVPQEREKTFRTYDEHLERWKQWETGAVRRPMALEIHPEGFFGPEPEPEPEPEPYYESEPEEYAGEGQLYTDSITDIFPVEPEAMPEPEELAGATILETAPAKPEDIKAVKKGLKKGKAAGKPGKKVPPGKPGAKDKEAPEEKPKRGLKRPPMLLKKKKKKPVKSASKSDTQLQETESSETVEAVKGAKPTGKKPGIPKKKGLKPPSKSDTKIQKAESAEAVTKAKGSKLKKPGAVKKAVTTAVAAAEPVPETTYLPITEENFEALEQQIEEEMRKAGQEPSKKSKRKMTREDFMAQKKRFLELHNKAYAQMEELEEDLEFVEPPKAPKGRRRLSPFERRRLSLIPEEDEEEWISAPEFFREQTGADALIDYGLPDTEGAEDLDLELLPEEFLEIEDDPTEEVDLLLGTSRQRTDDIAALYRAYRLDLPTAAAVPVTVPRPSVVPKRTTVHSLADILPSSPEQPTLEEYMAQFPEKPVGGLEWESPEIQYKQLAPVPFTATTGLSPPRTWGPEIVKIYEGLYRTPPKKTIPTVFDLPATADTEMLTESPPREWASPVSPQVSPIDSEALKRRIYESYIKPDDGPYSRRIGGTTISRYSHGPIGLGGPIQEAAREPPSHLTLEEMEIREQIDQAERIKGRRQIRLPHRTLQRHSQAPGMAPIEESYESPVKTLPGIEDRPYFHRDIFEESPPDIFEGFAYPVEELPTKQRIKETTAQWPEKQFKKIQRAPRLPAIGASPTGDEYSGTSPVTRSPTRTRTTPPRVPVGGYSVMSPFVKPPPRRRILQHKLKKRRLDFSKAPTSPDEEQVDVTECQIHIAEGEAQTDEHFKRLSAQAAALHPRDRYLSQISPELLPAFSPTSPDEEQVDVTGIQRHKAEREAQAEERFKRLSAQAAGIHPSDIDLSEISPELLPAFSPPSPVQTGQWSPFTPPSHVQEDELSPRTPTPRKLEVTEAPFDDDLPDFSPPSPLSDPHVMEQTIEQIKAQEKMPQRKIQIIKKRYPKIDRLKQFYQKFPWKLPERISESPAREFAAEVGDVVEAELEVQLEAEARRRPLIDEPLPRGLPPPIIPSNMEYEAPRPLTYSHLPYYTLPSSPPKELREVEALERLMEDGADILQVEPVGAIQPSGAQLVAEDLPVYHQMLPDSVIEEAMRQQELQRAAQLQSTSAAPQVVEFQYQETVKEHKPPKAVKSVKKLAKALTGKAAQKETKKVEAKKSDTKIAPKKSVKKIPPKKVEPKKSDKKLVPVKGMKKPPPEKTKDSRPSFRPGGQAPVKFPGERGQRGVKPVVSKIDTGLKRKKKDEKKKEPPQPPLEFDVDVQALADMSVAPVDLRQLNLLDDATAGEMEEAAGYEDLGSMPSTSGEGHFIADQIYDEQSQSLISKKQVSGKYVASLSPTGMAWRKMTQQEYSPDRRLTHSSGEDAAAVVAVADAQYASLLSPSPKRRSPSPPPISPRTQVLTVEAEPLPPSPRQVWSASPPARKSPRGELEAEEAPFDFAGGSPLSMQGSPDILQAISPVNQNLDDSELGALRDVTISPTRGVRGWGGTSPIAEEERDFKWLSPKVIDFPGYR